MSSAIRVGMLLVLIMSSALASALGAPKKMPSKMQLIRACMTKQMLAHQQLFYYEAAKTCKSQLSGIDKAIASASEAAQGGKI